MYLHRPAWTSLKAGFCELTICSSLFLIYRWCMVNLTMGGLVCFDICMVSKSILEWNFLAMWKQIKHKIWYLISEGVKISNVDEDALMNFKNKWNYFHLKVAIQPSRAPVRKWFFFFFFVKFLSPKSHLWYERFKVLENYSWNCSFILRFSVRMSTGHSLPHFQSSQLLLKFCRLVQN